MPYMPLDVLVEVGFELLVLIKQYLDSGLHPDIFVDASQRPSQSGPHHTSIPILPHEPCRSIVLEGHEEDG